MSIATYLNQQGRIVRTRFRPRLSSSSSSSSSSLARIAVLLTIFIICFVTNPANRGLLMGNLGNSRTSAAWLPKSNRRLTNFAIFSLERRWDGVGISGLMQSFRLCRYNSNGFGIEFGLLCQRMAENICHEKPLLDLKTDWPFAAHRILCGLVLFFFWIPLPWCGFVNKVLDVTMSVFHQPQLMDLIDINIYIYPTFVSIQKVVTAFSFKGNPRLNFTLAVLVLVLGIGGISNWFATKVTGRQVCGMRGVAGASLGFQQAFATRAILFRFLGIALTPAHAFWTNAAFLILSQNPGNLIAWLVGGTIGNSFGHYHLDQLNLWDTFWL